jgi:hypothetical protein
VRNVVMMRAGDVTSRWSGDGPRDAMWKDSRGRVTVDRLDVRNKTT